MGDIGHPAHMAGVEEDGRALAKGLAHGQTGDEDAGEDVSVLGVDGAPVGEFMLPSLSTIQQSTVELGQLSADLMLRQSVKEISP